MFPKCVGVRKRCRVICLFSIVAGASFFIGLRTENILKVSSGRISNRKIILFPAYNAKSNWKTTQESFRRDVSVQNQSDGRENTDTNEVKNKRGKGHHLMATDEEHITSNRIKNKTLLFSNVYPFQSAISEEFPTAEEIDPIIPHIFHQIYANEMIPNIYIKHIKSFIRYNPTWEYRFWTDASGRQFLQKHHPYLLRVFDGLGNTVGRSDLLRYAVLYEYGGFYADFDTQTLRSFNKTTMKYSCIFPVEPFEHSAFLYNKTFIINNAIMGCRPKHQFLKLLLSGLRYANVKGHPVRETGPVYVTRRFIQYNHIKNERDDCNKTDWSSNSPYFYKGELKEDDSNAVYVPNSQYFIDNIDPLHLAERGVIKRLCGDVHSLAYLQRRGCFEFEIRKRVRKERQFTFTIHHWYHIWMKNRKQVAKILKTDIKDIVPKCIQYNNTIVSY